MKKKNADLNDRDIYNCGLSRRRFLQAAGAAGVAAWSVMRPRDADAVAALAAMYPDRAADAETSPETIDLSSRSVARNVNKCIGCGNCVRVCADVQKIGVYRLYPDPEPARHGGRQFYSDTKGGFPLAETGCINCGQCTKVCPAEALTERDGLAQARYALRNQDRYAIVWQIAPSVQNMLGESYAAQPGADFSRKIAAAMKQLGGRAFHTDFAADVTIMEEGGELIRRLRGGGVLPMLTSCCPGWVRYAEMHYPDLLAHISTTKSPQQIFGALAKSYYAREYNVPADNVYQISVMPCTAKKYECARAEMRDALNRRQVDLVLTAREFMVLLAERGINLNELAGSDFDRLLREGSGAARIFGASGGVMEASLRAVSILLTGRPLPPEPGTLRTRDGVKEAALVIGGQRYNFAAVNGISNIQAVMTDLRQGHSPYHFIEVMACPHGCIGGGGALHSSVEAPWAAVEVERRQEGLYRSDSLLKNTDCLQNNELKLLYRNFLGRPGGPLAEELLHTRYTDRSGELPPAL